MEDGAMVRVTRPRKLYDTIVAKARSSSCRGHPLDERRPPEDARPRESRHGDSAVTVR
jgi:hypothetical protein